MKHINKTRTDTSGSKANIAKARQRQTATKRQWCAGIKNVLMDSGWLWWRNDYKMFQNYIRSKDI